MSRLRDKWRSSVSFHVEGITHFLGKRVRHSLGTKGRLLELRGFCIDWRIIQLIIHNHIHRPPQSGSQFARDSERVEEVGGVAQSMSHASLSVGDGSA
jgi:hypothetical protein